MKVKKVITYLLLSVIVLENAMTSYAVEGGGIAVNTEVISEQEIENEDAVESSVVNSAQTNDILRDKDNVDEVMEDEKKSEIETLSQSEESSEETAESSESETLSENETLTESEDTVGDTTVVDETDAEDDTTMEEDTDIETETETETEAIAEEKKIDNKSASEDEDIRYILGRPMTDEEIAEQLAMVPDYLPELPVDRLGGTDLMAGLDDFTTFSDEELPEKFDLRDEGIVTPVKNQNPWGTCWSFATMALLESSWKAQYGETLDLSEHHLAYFVKNTGYDALNNSNDDTIEGTDNSYYLKAGGNLLSATTKLMNWHGAALESKYPYPTSETVPDALNRDVAQDRDIIASDVYFIPINKNTAQDEKVTTIKKALQQYGCVQWSYRHNDAYLNNHTAAYYFDLDNYATNHAITVVGWDDTYEKENFLEAHRPTNDGAWIVKNSWGSSWGDKGYCYISYEDKSLGNGNEPGVAKAAMADEYDNNYFYGNITSTLYYIYYNYGTEMAQVYQIKGESTQQTIEAVSTMFYNDNQSYSIQLYKNPTLVDGVVQDPSSGTPLLDSPVTGTIGYAGLYTIAMPEVTVNVDDYVAIVISFNGEKGYINEDKSDAYDTVTETNITYAGQSLKKSSSSSSWTDLHTSGTSLKINLLTTDANVTVTKPELTYTVSNILDFNDELACNLKWNKCTDVKNYKLYRAEQGSGEYTLLATLDADVRSYKDVVGNENTPKTYNYKVVAVFNDGTSSESDVVEVELRYQFSFEIDSFKQYMDKVVLTWDTVDGATGYMIERKKQGDAQYEKVADIADSEATTYTCDTKELDWAVYEYRMRAYKDENVYTDWSEIQITTDFFKITQNSPVEINVTWNEVPNAKYYRIIRETSTETIRWGISGASAVTIEHLDYYKNTVVGKNHSFYISAYASTDDYNNDNPMYKSGTIYFYTVPDSPTNLKGTYENKEATFMWYDALYAEKMYIYRSMDKDDKGETPYAKIDASSHSYTDNTFSEYGTYYYWFVPVVITGDNIEIVGEPATCSILVTTEPVVMESVTEESETSLKVSWEAYTGAESYIVYRKAGSTGSYTKLTTISDKLQTSYVDEGVTIGKTYYYKVSAVCEGAETSIENVTEISGKTKPEAPKLVKATFTELQIESNTELEYAVGIYRYNTSGYTFVQGTGNTLTFTGLTDNKTYYVHVRTRTDVTGEDAVAGEILEVKTQEVTRLELKTDKIVLEKGKMATVTAKIASDIGEEVYTDTITWKAVNASGTSCTVTTSGEDSIVKGKDGKEILRITDRQITATGLSTDKIVTLTGTVKMPSYNTFSATCSITIEVPVTGVAIEVLKVNDTASSSLEGLEVGDSVLLEAVLSPENTDGCNVTWSSSDSSVATVMQDSTNLLQATVKLLKPGKTTIRVETTDGDFYDEIEVEAGLKPVVMTSVTEVSEAALKVSWEECIGAESYIVYRKAGSTGNYTKLTTISDTSQISYVDEGLTIGKTYYYKVSAVCEDVETSIENVTEKSGRTKPAVAKLVKIGFTELQIESNEKLEYAVGKYSFVTSSYTFVQGTGGTLSFTGLTDNKTYYVHVRTRTDVTGEDAVAGEILEVKTQEVTRLELKTDKIVLEKGEMATVTAKIASDTGEEVYTDTITWKAVNESGTSCTVTKSGEDSIVKGKDGKEILRITDRQITATGLSTDKVVTLTGTVKMPSYNIFSATCNITIEVPATGVDIEVLKINDKASSSINELEVDDTVVLGAVLTPENTDDTDVTWSSSDVTVATVEKDSTNSSQAIVKILKAGKAVIIVETEDGSHSASITVDVRLTPVTMKTVEEISETELKVSWDACTGAEGYNVYRKAGSTGNYEPLITINDGSQTTYVDQSITTGKTYYYKVTAISNSVESSLDKTIAVSGQTKPDTPILVGTYLNTIKIQSNADFEYAISTSNNVATDFEFISGNGGELSFSGLKDATQYYVFVRTKQSVTGEAAVYSKGALKVTTNQATDFVFSLSKNAFVPGETADIEAKIKSSSEETEYLGDIEWAAVNESDESCSVSSTSTETTILGTDGKEILKINDRNMTIKGLSSDKEIVLTGKIITGEGKELTSECSVSINVTLAGFNISILSVNGEATSVLDGIDIDDSIVLEARLQPENADDVEVSWTSSDNTVATVTKDTTYPYRAIVEILNLGNTVIKVTNQDASISSEIQIDVKQNPVTVISAIEISETSAKITWEKYASADSYEIYRRDKNNDNYTQIATISDISQLEYIDDTLVTGKTYYYKVTAFRDGIETDLSKTEEKSVQTSPAQVTIVDNGISYDAITINSNTNYEYAIGIPGQTKETLTYYKATGATYVFSELSPNTRYIIYVRTDESVTGEEAVYGKELAVSTLVEAHLVLSVKDIVISKGNTVPFTYYIEPSNIHYNDNVEWKAMNSEGVLHTIEKIPNEVDAIKVKDSVGKEIFRISSGVLVATGESQEKKVYLTVSKGAIKADCIVQINVPVTKLDIGIESVNGNTTIKEIKDLKIGEYVQLNTTVTPINADDALVKWSSSNQSVASVENGLLTAKGVGSCEIKAYTDDGVYDTLTINVKKSKEISAIWLSDNIQLDVSNITPIWNEEMGEYTAEGLEANPSYTLGGVNSTKALAVYVLESGKLSKSSSGITLKSSDLSIVTVSNEGVVTALNAGEADIVAYDNYGNDVYGICHITVEGEKQKAPAPTGYPIDKSIKLSAVEKMILIEAFDNDAKSSKTVQIKNQMGHIYTGEELKVFSFTSSNPQACIVDENGEVRPNPTYRGKNANVKITAALNNDKAKRKVTFTVKVLTTKQIDRIEILQVGKTENESIIVQNYEKGATLTFKANAYNSKGVEISAPKLKYSLSDTGVATLKANKDGTVTVTWKKSGRTNLICTAADELKNKNQVQLVGVSTIPYISTKQLTVNVKNASGDYESVQYKESGTFRIDVQNGVSKNSVFIDSIRLGKNTLNEEQSNFKLIENADGSYKIAVRQDYVESVKKNSKFVLSIGVNVTNTLNAEKKDECVVVELKVASQEPKVTVSEAKTINRYYTNQNETLLILKAPNIVTDVEIVDNPNNKYDNYFAVKELYNGQWYLKFNNDDTYKVNSVKLNLRLTVAGYEPVVKTLNVQTPSKKQTLKQQLIPTIHYGDGHNQIADIYLYNQTAKKAFIGIGEIISFESEKLQLEAVSTEKIQVSVKSDKTAKNGETLSAKIKMKPDNWQNEISITLKVKLANKAPKIVTKASFLTLNNKVPKEKAMTSISTDQNNINICNSAMWDIKLYNASTKQYNSTDIFKAEYAADGGVLYVGFADGKVAGKGSYKIRLQNVLEGFENVYKDITIKVIDAEPKISVKTKGKLDLINRSNSTFIGTIKCTNSVSANVTGVKILADNKVDANEIFKAKLLSTTNTISISFTDNGIADNQLKKQKYMLPIEVTLENGTKLISEMAISLTQAVPKVVVPAQQTIIKSVNSLTRDYDFATKLAKGVEIERIDVISVPSGFSAVTKEGHVLVTLNNRGIKSGKYTFKVNIYFKGAQNATKPVTKNISVKVSE